MSRRKQSNPKPIKHVDGEKDDDCRSHGRPCQSEDSLDSPAALPPDAFTLRDGPRCPTLSTKRRIEAGATFGPYRGRLLRGGAADEELQAIQTKDELGDEVHFAVTDESGGWLRLLRPGDPCNAALCHNGFAAWCTITADLEPDTELVVRHQWAGDTASSRRKRRKEEEEEESRDSDAGRVSNAYCDLPNGTGVKCEPRSPPPGEDAFLNGANDAPAFPCGGTVSSTADVPVRCIRCDASFNSRRILDVHRAYYCRGSGTEAEEGGHPRAEPSTVHSPGASENDDNSPPPKDYPPSTPESPNSSVRRRRAASLGDTHPSPRRLLRCQYCHYSTDKKASLTRHVRMHGSVQRSVDGPPLLPTPPVARYCANCDIQFASYKNYQVHKEFYCNTRHVHKSVTSTSPTCQQQTSPQQHSPVGNPSPNADTAPKQAGCGAAVLGQPLYAAISTSPLILVPCSYVAGADGISPGLVPAGNIVIPNPQADPLGSVIPTFTVVPEQQQQPTLAEEVAKPEVKVAKSSPGECGKSARKEEEERPPAEQPLDLSFRKRDGEGPKHHLPDTGSARTSSSPALDDLNAPPSLSAMPLLGLEGGESAPSMAPSVLAKQGANRCADCNIVFYRHENYLVHKSKYCSARAVDSPEKSREDATEEDNGKSGRRSPLSSPRVGGRTPPHTTDGTDACETSPPVVQFYCMACGIKYTSLDNLRAHQFYYCPKREVQTMALVPPFPPPQARAAGQDHRCGKCRNAYPTEELLRQHPCTVQRKCPYCDVYCPTLSAAQRHLVTHTGIKSFRCSLCGYKGHTLRGMRTHIRIHLDKGSSTPEEAYILCMDEGGAEIACAGRKSSRVSSERVRSVISTEPPHGELAVSPVPAPPAVLMPADVLAIRAAPDDPVATGDTTHWCQICGYSSSYKGNVVRHVKLVHKDLVATQTMSNIVNSRPSAEGLPRQGSEPIEHAGKEEPLLSASATDHSNSSSSLDVKPVVNGLVNKTDPVSRLEEKPLLLKAETTSPPPSAHTGGSSKGVKRSLPEDGGAFTSKSGPKYCKSCDISFNFLSNFLAHKKFYCTPRLGDAPAQESTPAQPVQ